MQIISSLTLMAGWIPIGWLLKTWSNQICLSVIGSSVYIILLRQNAESNKVVMLKSFFWH